MSGDLIANGASTGEIVHSEAIRLVRASSELSRHVRSRVGLHGSNMSIPGSIAHKLRFDTRLQLYGLFKI
jgi:hypothetical protein